MVRPLRRITGAGAFAVCTVCAALATTTQLQGCAGAAAPLRLTQPVVLLGEVHDNAAQHALRLAAYRALLAAGARPVLALEQIDRERQGELDALLARRPPPSAAALVAAVGGAGWDWSFYTPFIALAIEYRLPIVAANVGRDEAQRVMREGLAAGGFDADVPERLLATQAGDIQASHCGTLAAADARRMALAQIARDQFMARVLEQHAARGVVLLAGDGHVRTDIGVPYWLAAATRARSESIGFVEAGNDDTPYDRRVVTAPQPRADPCEALHTPARS